MAESLLAEEAENQALLVNDIQVLVSQLNERILQAQERGFQLQVCVKEAWHTSESFMRKRIAIRAWREIQ